MVGLKIDTVLWYSWVFDELRSKEKNDTIWIKFENREPDSSFNCEMSITSDWDSSLRWILLNLPVEKVYCITSIDKKKLTDYLEEIAIGNTKLSR